MKAARLVRLLLLVMIVAMVMYGNHQATWLPAETVREIPYSQFLLAVDEDAVQLGAFHDNEFRGRFLSGRAFRVALNTHDSRNRQDLTERLAAHGVSLEAPAPLQAVSPRAVATSLCFFVALSGMSYWLFLRRASATK